MFIKRRDWRPGPSVSSTRRILQEEENQLQKEDPTTREVPSKNTRFRKHVCIKKKGPGALGPASHPRVESVKRILGLMGRLGLWPNTSGRTRLAKHVWPNTSGRTRPAEHAWPNTPGRTRAPAEHVLSHHNVCKQIPGLHSKRFFYVCFELSSLILNLSPFLSPISQTVYP